MDKLIESKDCLLKVFKAHVSLASVKAFLDWLAAHADTMRKAALEYRDRFASTLVRVLSLVVELLTSGQAWGVLCFASLN
jgi:hypothetical protein